MHIFCIYGIFFVCLFSGLMITLGLPGYLTVATELLIVLLFLIALITSKMRRGFVADLWYVFFFLALIAFCSLALNRSKMLPSIFSLRLLFRYYVLYLAIISLSLPDHTIKKTNAFLTILILLQLPVVAYKFCLYGISEHTMGAYAQHGGTLTTILPIVVLFYVAAYYFLYQPKRWYVLTGFGFILFSIGGGKRAVLFLYPLQFLAIYYYIYIKGRGVHLSNKVGALLLVFASIVIVCGSILHFNKTLNPEGKVAGGVDVGHALSYAKDYTTRESGAGYTTGRYSTAKRIFEGLVRSGFVHFFFGMGPGSMTQSLFDSARQRAVVQAMKDRFMFSYGLTSSTRIAIEYGMLGVIVYSLMAFVFARMCWRYYKCEVDPYWKAFAAGSVGFAFSMLFFFFAYGDAAFWGDTMPAIYFYVMGVVYTRWRRSVIRITKTNPLTTVAFTAYANQ